MLKKRIDERCHRRHASGVRANVTPNHRDADRRRMKKIPKLAGSRVTTTLNKQPRDLVRSAAFFNLTQI